MLTASIFTGGEATSGGYFKGFESTDDYVSMISRNGRAFVGRTFIWSEEDPHYSYTFVNFSGDVISYVSGNLSTTYGCDVNYDGSIALFAFESIE